MAIDKIFNDANVDGIADNIFGAVNNSVSEVKQMQQRKAAENVQMVVEAFKKIETNITAKFDNVTDVIEKRVLTIKDGRDGSSGSDGRNGRDGKPGRDGVNGKQGTPGTPGKDGVDGKDGVSVTDASIDFDGSLVISLSSGQQINVGEVVPPELERQLVELRQGGGSAGSSGDVMGPTASTDNAIARFDGTSGKLVQNSVVTIADTTGNMAGVGTLGVGAITTTGALVGAATQSAFNTVSTTLNIGGAATAVNIGAATGTLTVANTTLAAKAITASTTLGVTGVATLGNGAILGIPASGTVTNLTGTASININGTVGATTATTGAFTTVTASGQGAINSAIATNSTFQISGTYAGTGGLFDGGLFVNVDGGTMGVNRTISQSYFGYGPDNAASTITTAASGTNDISTTTIFPYVITSGGATLTNATTLAINDAPNLGTNKRALWVKAGLSQLDGGLAVTGTLSATGTLSGGTSGTAYSFSGSAPATSLTLNSSGNLGIGTSSPAAKLHIGVADAAVDGTKGVKIVNASGTTVVLECGVSNDSFVGTTSGSSFSIRTGNTVRATFGSGGGLAVTGTLSVTTGAAVGGATAGAGGLAFPATAVAVADANTLDDYEEGTWTPLATSTGGVTGGTYSTQFGRYTKVGNLVTCQFIISLTTAGTYGDSVYIISGLPFTTSNMAANAGAGYCGYMNGSATALNSLFLNVENSQNYFYTNALTSTTTGISNVKIFGDSSDLRGIITYFV